MQYMFAREVIHNKVNVPKIIYSTCLHVVIM